jgi:hypothetical protein
MTRWTDRQLQAAGTEMLHGRIDIIGREPLRADVMSRAETDHTARPNRRAVFSHALLAAENIGILFNRRRGPLADIYVDITPAYAKEFLLKFILCRHIFQWTL